MTHPNEIMLVISMRKKPIIHSTKLSKIAGNWTLSARGNAPGDLEQREQDFADGFQLQKRARRPLISSTKMTSGYM